MIKTKLDKKQLASFYGLPCYWEESTQTLEPKWNNWFGNLLLLLLTELHGIVIFLCTLIDDEYEPTFPIKVKLDKKL